MGCWRGSKLALDRLEGFRLRYHILIPFRKKIDLKNGFSWTLVILATNAAVMFRFGIGQLALLVIGNSLLRARLHLRNR